MLISVTIRVAQKEIKKYMGNVKIVFSTLLLPGLVLFLIYSILGDVAEQQYNNIETGIAYVVDIPDTFNSIIQTSNLSIQNIDAEKIHEVKEKIQEQDKSILIVFEEDFEKMVEDEQNPNVEIFYNSIVAPSLVTFNIANQLLSDYKDTFTTNFTINRGDEIYDLVTMEDNIGKNISVMLPMLIVTLVFTACVSVAAESYAGERERKTLIKLLISPIDRMVIVVGKTIALSFLAFISGMSSFIGALLALPKLYSFESDFLLKVYSIGNLLLIIINIFSLSILLISVMSIISARATTIKEATSTLSPFGGIAMLMGMTSIIQSEPARNVFFYLLPIYNNVQVLYELLMLKFSVRDYTVMIIANTLIAFVMIWILSNIINNEEVMYS